MNFSESWKNYTIRDKILFGSFILPFFISIIHLLIYFPIFGMWIYDAFLGGLLFGEDKIFQNWTCENYTLEVLTGSGIEKNSGCRITFVYIISPIWLLLSTISIGIYGFFLFKTDEETSKILNREVYDKSGPSALFRTNTFMIITAGAQILIFLSLIISSSGYFDGLFEGTTYNYLTSYNYEGSEWTDASINPFSYLYFPHLIATVALAYYSRNKNIEENSEFIEETIHSDVSIEQSKSEDVDVNEEDSQSELKNTCKRCGKIWYLDADELKDLESRLETSTKLTKGMGGISMATALFNPMMAAQHTTTMAANTGALKSLADELNEKSRCPECQSKKIDRVLVDENEKIDKKVAVEKKDESSLVDELKKLNELKEQGILDEEEFKTAKRKLMEN